jgi:OMF family outer membrane factor
MSDDQTLNANLQLHIPLFTWGRITNNKKRALLGVDMASSRQQNSRMTALNQVVIAHAQVMLAREARTYLKDTISEMDLFFHTAKADFEAGARNAPEKDVLQIQYDLYDMKTWLQELDKWEAIGLEALKISMGLPPNTELTLRGHKLPVLPFKPEAEKTIQLALNTNPQIKELEKAIEATRLAVKIAKVGNLPMIGAFGSQSWIEDNYDANPDSITAYGIGVEMNIFDGGLARNRAAESKLQCKEMEAKLHGLKRAVQLQITQEILEIQQYYNQLEIRARARKIAEKQVEVVQQGYQYGIATVKDVNDSQVQKRWSDANWLFKKLDYIKAVSRLNQSIGKELLILN